MLRENRVASAAELLRACELLAALPEDAPYSYAYDDVTIAIRDAKGEVRGLVNGAFSYRHDPPVLFSMLKPPRPAR